MPTQRNLNLEEDDYCENCGTRTSMMADLPWGRRRVPVACKCRLEEYEKQKELDRNKEKQIKLERLAAYSLMDSGFKKCTFENFEIDSQNKDFYKLGIEYCNNWKKMKENNVGMILMGNPGVGKTYLSFCIANKLLSEYVPVIAISTINLVNKIFESYSKNGEEGEAQIINSLKNADLLILDDLGAEHGKDKTKQIIYSVIDSRVRADKPIIITTNLNEQQLRRKLVGEDAINRTYDRLTEVSPVIEVEGESRRIQSGNRKYEILTSLLAK